MTNISTITDQQIRMLSQEAGQAGDMKQVAICNRALAGSARARRECARVIRAARIHGLPPAILRQAQARAEAAGESLSDVLRRLVARYAEHGEHGQRGGYARAESLSQEQRSDSARKAAQARWQGK